MLKFIVQFILQHLAKKYLKIQQPKLVVVAGSVGKTGTKTAIATVLIEKYRVRLHEGNHNTEMSVPLSILGIDYPSDVRSITSWWRVYQAAKLRISGQKDVDVIVQELGTDRPGDIKQFSKYLRPDVAVVTAVSPEHMENFSDLDAVAKEELSVTGFSDYSVINRDDIDGKYASITETNNLTTYGVGEKAEYRLDVAEISPLEGRAGKIICPEWGDVPVSIQLIGEHNLKAAAAAAAVAAKLGLDSQQAAVGIAKITPTKGRMRLLRGLNNTTLIDDTYNASPLATKAALSTLYLVDAKQRLAILGSMNELGGASADLHRDIGKFCDPNQLDWVITIGQEAEKYLAPAAKQVGCQVKSFTNPLNAGAFAHKVMQPGAVILAKGSQNGVFAEEALKVLLHSTEDHEDLVRQSSDWLEKKAELLEQQA